VLAQAKTSLKEKSVAAPSREVTPQELLFLYGRTLSEEKERKSRGKGSVYLKPGMGFDEERMEGIRAFAAHKRMRGFSDLVRSMFQEPAKFFTGLFTDPEPETVEVFGDLKEEDGRVRIDFSKWSDEELLATRRGLRLVLEDVDEESEKRGLEEEGEEDIH